MKVLIPYGKKTSRQTLEGSRLRKTLKGECELSGIEWVDSVVREPDLAHLLSLREENLLADMRWRKIPTVVSAFYCENEPRGAFLETNKEGEVAIKPKGIKFLNRADLVLTPNDAMRNLCLSSGVRTPIKVHATSINLARFEPEAREREIFPRYFGVRPSEVIAIATGEYGDRETIRRYRDLASRCPGIQFYFFGSTKRMPVEFAMYNASRSAPKNLHFESLVQDDIYRSALLRADAYLALDPRKTESVALLEAFAAKTQVVALFEHRYEPLIKNGETAWVASSIEEAALCLSALYSKEKKSTIIPAYEMAKRCAIEDSAKELKRIYTSFLLERA